MGRRHRTPAPAGRPATGPKEWWAGCASRTCSPIGCPCMRRTQVRASARVRTRAPMPARSASRRTRASWVTSTSAMRACSAPSNRRSAASASLRTGTKRELRSRLLGIDSVFSRCTRANAPRSTPRRRTSGSCSASFHAAESTHSATPAASQPSASLTRGAMRSVPPGPRHAKVSSSSLGTAVLIGAGAGPRVWRESRTVAAVAGEPGSDPDLRRDHTEPYPGNATASARASGPGAAVVTGTAGLSAACEIAGDQLHHGDRCQRRGLGAQHARAQ